MEKIARELMNKIGNMGVEREGNDRGQGTNGMDTKLRELDKQFDKEKRKRKGNE